ncbi:MAG TPA: LuxR C-terminal-related transcriptional regulator [Candidatus Dormibacteraeota bacterium]
MGGAVVAELPVQSTSFVGREAELDALARVVRTSRLVTITGAAGMGKTRLAIELAARQPAEGADIRFVGLASLTEAQLLPHEVAARLGVRESAGEPLMRTLIAHIDGTPSLLVIDNCEHLVDACAPLVDHLLRGCANLRIVATSLQPLRVPGEVVWRITPLSVPGRRHDAGLQAVTGSEAVQLFVSRARQVRQDFAVEPGNADAVALLCRRLEGIPLAIELAAARIERMSVVDILVRLEDRFRLLVRDARTANVRHRTLRAALDWGHQLLDERERLVLRRVAIFGGGFDLAAAEAVCADAGLEASEVAESVFRLVETSLVVSDTDRRGPARYRLLEAVRQYGAELLAESGDGPAVAAAHAGRFLVIADRAMRAQRTPDRQRWLERLDSELDNLRIALDWCRTHDAGTWLLLARSLSWFWVTRGHFSEGLRWMEGALANAGAEAPGRLGALLAAAQLSFWQGDYASAQARCEACLDLGRRHGEDDARAEALTLLGSIHANRGEYEDGRRRFEEALAAARDEHERMEAMVWMGEMLLQAGEIADARARLEAVLALARGPEGPRGRAALFLGLVDVFAGDHADARERIATSLDIFERQGNHYAAAASLDGFAALAVANSDPVRALRLSSAADAIRASTGSQLAPRWREIVRTVIIEPATAAAGDRAAAAWAEGGRMTFDDAVSYARTGLGRPSPPPAPPQAAAPPGRAPAGLTRRELQVAELVADGMTNREIADRLVIAERTVEGHVERIRAKLNVHSRTQVAASMLRARAWPSGDAPT